MHPTPEETRSWGSSTALSGPTTLRQLSNTLDTLSAEARLPAPSTVSIRRGSRHENEHSQEGAVGAGDLLRPLRPLGSILAPAAWR